VEDTGSPLAPIYSVMGAIRGDPGNSLAGAPPYGQVYFGQDLNTDGVLPRMWEWNGAAWTLSGTWSAQGLNRSVGMDFLPPRSGDTPARATTMIVNRLGGSGTVIYTYAAQGGGIGTQWTVSNTPTGATYFINRIASDPVGNLAVLCKAVGTLHYRGLSAEYWAAPDVSGSSTDVFSKGFAHVKLTDSPPVFKAASSTPDTVPADGVTTTTLKALVQDKTATGYDVLSVTVDLTPIGGPAAAAMVDGGVPGIDPTIHVYTLVTSVALGSCPGSYNLAVKATDTAYPPDPQTITSSTIPLQVTAEVCQGFVASGLSGGAIEGAAVTVTQCTGITAAATSAADGSFVINVPQGACTLSVTAGGWNTGAGSTQAIVVPAGGLLLTDTLKLYPKTIQEAQVSDVLSPVGVTGTVTSVAPDGSTIYGIQDSGMNTQWLIFIQDSSGSGGAERAIPLRGDFTAGQIVEGDQVECRGTLRRLLWDNVLAVDVSSPADNWIYKIPGAPAPIAPKVVTLDWLNTSDARQGILVRINGVTVDTIPGCGYLRAFEEGSGCGTTNWGTSEQLYWYLGMRVNDGTTWQKVVCEVDNPQTVPITYHTGIPWTSLPPVGTTVDLVGVIYRYLALPYLSLRKPTDVVVGAAHTFPGPGWNMMSIPLDPAGSKLPTDVFYIVELARTLDASELSASALNRYSDVDKSYIPYDEFAPETFGDMNPRDGYWFNYYQAQPFTLRYNGVPRATEVDFSLLYPGWNIVGYGQLSAQNLGDPAGDGVGGTQIVNNGLGGAVDTFRNSWYVNGWVSGPLQTWDPLNLAYWTVGVDCPAFEWNASTCEPWFGYWFNSNQPDLLWRIPLPPATPLCTP